MPSETLCRSWHRLDVLTQVVVGVVYVCVRARVCVCVCVCVRARACVEGEIDGRESWIGKVWSQEVFRGFFLKVVVGQGFCNVPKGIDHMCVCVYTHTRTHYICVTPCSLITTDERQHTLYVQSRSRSCKVKKNSSNNDVSLPGGQFTHVSSYDRPKYRCRAYR